MKTGWDTFDGIALLDGVLLEEALGGSLDHDEELGGCLDHDEALGGYHGLAALQPSPAQRALFEGGTVWEDWLEQTDFLDKTSRSV